MNMKLGKPLLSAVLAFSLLLSPLPAVGGAFSASTATAAPAAATMLTDSSIKVLIDGKELPLSQSPYISNGVAYAPMRDIFEAMNATVSWDNAKQIVSGSKDGRTISLAIGSKEATVDGKVIPLTAASVIKDGTTFVPIRFIAESLAADVIWDGAARTVLVSTVKKSEVDFLAELNETRNMPILTPKEIVDLHDEAVVLLTTDRGQGSGVVIANNLVLTNYHVIENAAAASMVTKSGKSYDIEGVVVYDEKADLAIIKLSAELTIKPVVLGYGFASYKGDNVIAIGSPLAVQNTVSDGLISNIFYEEGIRYIQTSAPIDHGSSGGALFNQYGQLIGITTLGITSSNADINFAVSVIHAKELESKITKEKLAAAAFLPSKLPQSLAKSSMDEIREVMEQHFNSQSTDDGVVRYTDWQVKRDNEGWLVFTANIDPIFYMYYGESSASAIRLWMINLGYELHSLLPHDRIQVLVYFDRVYGFKPRGLEADEVSAIGGGQWRVRYPVIDMQLKDELYIEYRI